VEKAVQENLRGLGKDFHFEGDFVRAAPLGHGHIHTTFVAEYRGNAGSRRYVLQRLNTKVFSDPSALAENLQRISEHLQAKLVARGTPDAERRYLRPLSTRTGAPLLIDPEGSHWRAFPFIEGTRSCNEVEGPAQAREAARAFGCFAADLRDLPGPPLAFTIPDFHDLTKRMDQLREAIHLDARGRAAAIGAEIESAQRIDEQLARALIEAGARALPTRVMHNDCKLNNLLLDADSGEGLCVIDLDTVMDGTLLCDFGELVRSGASHAAEDEPNLAAIRFDLELFTALAEGYLAGTGGFLTSEELHALPLAGPTLTLENAVRFLADHLAGDGYFRIHHAGQNLDRARAQFRLAEQMLDALDTTRRIVANLAG